MSEILESSNEREKSKTINIVCNASVSYDQIRKRGGKQNYKQDFKVACIFLIRSLISIVAMIITIIVYFRLLSIFGMIFFVFSLPLLIMLLRYAKLHSSNYRLPITNILLDSAGIKFAWNYESSKISRRLDWTDLELVHSVKLKSNQVGVIDGDLVIMRFRMNNFSFEERLATKVQLKLLQSYEERGFVLNDLFTHRDVKVRIPLDMFTLEADKMRFISALGEWSPKEKLSDNFKDLANSSSAPTYTQLWLDDMQSFKRKRIEPLSIATELQQGRFKVVDKIASGGQAQIYLATDSAENRKVVLKEFVLPVSAGNEVRNRSFSSVKTEALLLSGLDHPGIVHLYDHFVEDHRAYLVLEHIQGNSLRKHVSEHGPMDSVVLKDYLIQLCDILNYLHNQTPPMVHRDFTPANLVLTNERIVKLIDFNVAHLMESTNTKTVVGKHSYMAPEQFRGKPCPQSDLYSLGCTVFFLLTGEDPVPLSQSKIDSKENVQSEIVALVSSLTAKKVADRIQTAEEISKIVESISSSGLTDSEAEVESK